LAWELIFNALKNFMLRQLASHFRPSIDGYVALSMLTIAVAIEAYKPWFHELKGETTVRLCR